MILTSSKQAIAQIDQYNQDAKQMLLRAADGCGGTWVRHGQRVSMADLIKGSINDNQKGE